MERELAEKLYGNIKLNWENRVSKYVITTPALSGHLSNIYMRKCIVGLDKELQKRCREKNVFIMHIWLEGTLEPLENVPSESCTPENGWYRVTYDAKCDTSFMVDGKPIQGVDFLVGTVQDGKHCLYGKGIVYESGTT